MSHLEKIDIKLNGETFSIETNSSIEQLLVAMGKGIGDASQDSPRKFGAVAVELNAEIVARDQFGRTSLESGDEVEVVTLVGGG